MAALGVTIPDKWQSQQFKVGDLQLAAKRWGSQAGLPVLALHGWLDNSASFDALGQKLSHLCDFVALDLAGHGLSDHRPHLGAYNIWQDIVDVFVIADQLGWRKFNLIGHSRGAMIAFLAAGTFPNRIRQLTMIEGIHPRTATAEDTPRVLADSIQFLRASIKRQKTVYQSFNDAVVARVKGLVPVSQEDAEVLATRGLQQHAGGFSWHYDPKLLAGSEIRMTREQVDAFKHALPTDKLLIVAEHGLVVHDRELMNWIAGIEQLSLERYAGGHHLHMSEQSDALADLIASHLTKNQAS